MRLVERLITIGVLALLFVACTELSEPINPITPQPVNPTPLQVNQPKLRGFLATDLLENGAHVLV